MKTRIYLFVLLFTACLSGACSKSYLKTESSRSAADAVKIKVGNATNYFAKIDNGPWVSYLNASGAVASRDTHSFRPE